MNSISKDIYIDKLDDRDPRFKVGDNGDLISDLKGEEILAMSYKKEFQKTNQKYFGFEKGMERKGDELYIK